MSAPATNLDADSGADPGSPPETVTSETLTATSVRPSSRRRKQRTDSGDVAFEARRVRRVIRHIDPWSVFKVSLVFFVCVWMMFIVAALIVWAIAEGSGTVEQIEKFVQDLLNYEWRLNGNFIFREYGLLGLILTFACTGMSVVGAVVFNLISDVVGGVWVTVIEEETKRPVSG